MQILLPSWGSQSAILLLENNIRFKFRLPCFSHQNPNNPMDRNFFFRWILSIFNPILLSYHRLKFFQQGLNWKLHSCWSGFKWKIFDFYTWMKILIFQNFQKVVVKNDLTRLSKWCFSVTTVLISFNRVKISKHTLREKDLIQISISWFFASKYRQSQNRVFLFCWVLSILNLIILCNYRLNLFHQRLNRELETFTVRLDEILNCFDPCLRFLIFRKI